MRQRTHDKGLLIVVDGMDGSGKGSIVELTLSYLRIKLGPEKVWRTKEPGGTPVGDAIRGVLFKPGLMSEMAPGVVDLLFLASHVQNYRSLVEPALAQGCVVVSDRWPYSQEAYSTQRSVPTSISRAYWDESGIFADLLIFLHGDPQVLVERANRRTTETHQATKVWNDLEVLTKIQQAYFDLFSRRPEMQPICVDGLSVEDTWSFVRPMIDRELARRNIA